MGNPRNIPMSKGKNPLIPTHGNRKMGETHQYKAFPLIFPLRVPHSIPIHNNPQNPPLTENTKTPSTMHFTPLLTTLLATFALARPNLHHHHNHNALPRNINAGPLVTGTHTPSFPTATAAATGYAYPTGTLAIRDELPYEMPTPRMPIPIMTTLRTSRPAEERAYTVM